MKKFKNVLSVILLVFCMMALVGCSKVEEPTQADVEEALEDEGYIPEDEDTEWKVTVEKCKINDDKDEATVDVVLEVTEEYVVITKELEVCFELDDKSWKCEEVEEADSKEVLYKHIPDELAIDQILAGGEGADEEDDEYYGEYSFWIICNGSDLEIFLEDLESVEVIEHKTDVDDLIDNVKFQVLAVNDIYTVTFTVWCEFEYDIYSEQWMIAPVPDIKTDSIIEYREQGFTTEPETGNPDGGQVINIYSYNDEFQTRLSDYYPGYEAIDYYTGRIGEVTVNWIYYGTEANEYQNKLDTALMQQEYVPADESIDLFLVEPDYANKYINTPYTLALSELGITDADLGSQYQYTKDVMTDVNGEIKGSAWVATPGVLYYNREIAKAVWGTDDPEIIGEKLKDWDGFMTAAEEVHDIGFKMTASVDDTYRVYADNAETPWVVDGKICIPANIEKWIQNSKTLVDSGATDTCNMWEEEWYSGIYEDGDVFCYFGPAWCLNFIMSNEWFYENPTIAEQGGWAAVAGPQGFYWGGSYLCVASGTDNQTEIKDILLAMTCNDEVIKEIVGETGDFGNSASVMEELAAVDNSSEYLGGQDATEVYMENCEKISQKNMTPYDMKLDELLVGAMKDYFEGNCTYDEALEKFYDDAVNEFVGLEY